MNAYTWGLQSLLAKKAQIFSPQCIAEDNCLWVTGAGIFTSYVDVYQHKTGN